MLNLLAKVNIFNLLKEKLSLTKRQKIVTASILTTLALVISQTISPYDQIRFRFVIVAALVAFLVSLWALKEGINRIKIFTLLILPAFFTLGVGNIYFILLGRRIAKVWVDFGFGLSFYFMLLSQNVFNVAAVRTIPLYRAASTVSFIFTIFTAFLLFHVLHVFQQNFLWNGLMTGVISFLLTLPILWSIEMEGISLRLMMYAVVISVIMGEFAMGLSFWPIPPDSFIWAVPLAAGLFILVGISLDLLKERLGKNDLYLYFGLGILILTVLFLTSGWLR